MSSTVEVLTALERAIEVMAERAERTQLDAVKRSDRIYSDDCLNYAKAAVAFAEARHILIGR